MVDPKKIEAWAIEAQAVLDEGDIPALELEKARTTIEALHFLALVEQLREHEGAVLEIVCANPEFNGLPNEVVDITDDWTGWKPRRFGGHTLLEALRAAKTVRDIAMRETDAHGGERKPR